MPRVNTIIPYRSGRMPAYMVARLAAQSAMPYARYGARLARRLVGRAIPYVGPAMAAYDAVNSVRNMFSGRSRSTQTEAQQKRNKAYTRSYSTKYNRRSGFRWKKSKIVTRRGRRGYYKRRIPVVPKQPDAVVETNGGGTITDPQCVYVCGQTVPLNILRYSAWSAVLRQAFKMHGQEFKNYEDFIEGWGAAASITVSYRVSVNSGVTSVTIPGAVSQRFSSILQTLTNSTTFGMNDDGFFNEFVIRDQVGKVTYFDIQFVSMSFLCTTVLKMQNRSINELNDQTTDTIDRCPVDIRMFYGKGNGPVIDDQLFTADWFGSAGTAAVALAAGANTHLLTKPRPAELMYVERTFDYQLQPGEIKGEIVTSRFRYSLAGLVKMLERMVAQGIYNNCRYPVGHFKLVSVEKTIGNVSGNTQNVNIIYEAKNTICCTLTRKRNNIMVKRVLSTT